MTTDNTNSHDDREQAIAAWEAQQNRPLIAGPGKKSSGILIGAAALGLLSLVWILKQSHSEPSESQKPPELSIPERKPVPVLKTPESTNAQDAQGHADAASSADNNPLLMQQAQMEQQRLEQERKLQEARIKSSLIPPSVQAQPLTGSGAGAPSMGTGAADPTAVPTQERGPQDANSRFARSVSGNDVAVSTANTVEHLDYKVLQGKLIEAVLEPRANSDLPGMICATVQRDVYGAQGRVVLIPWGSRVCGVYSAELKKGQDRLFAVWNLLRRPDGVQVKLDSVGADQLGSAGMGGEVNTHFAQIFGVSALLSIIGAGATNIGVSGDTQYNSSAYYRMSVQQAAAQTSQQALQPYLGIQPTVTVPAGSRIRIYVNRDLDFTSIYNSEIQQSKNSGVIFLP